MQALKPLVQLVRVVERTKFRSTPGWLQNWSCKLCVGLSRRPQSFATSCLPTASGRDGCHLSSEKDLSTLVRTPSKVESCGSTFNQIVRNKPELSQTWYYTIWSFEKELFLFHIIRAKLTKHHDLRTSSQISDQDRISNSLYSKANKTSNWH